MYKQTMPGTTHIKSIYIVSNTHWDREFRQSFERTRRNLLTMMDTILDILEADPEYHSFTLDGHSILVDDYLEMRPEKKELVEKFIQANRLIIGPWYTLVEQFSISHESLVRNLLYGKNCVEKYGGKWGTVAYTPASWGQTGQLPQVLNNFGLDKIMFYRGISHHESEAEYIWQGADGTRVWASRFALYARYNWYYQVHRPVTRKGKVFDKRYAWGEFAETPLRFADDQSGNDPSYELQNPRQEYDISFLGEAIEQMVKAEGEHFTTPVFLAMHGHDISVAYPHESAIIKKAHELLGAKFHIKHTNLEEYWNEVIRQLDKNKLAVLKGEKRSYLKTGMWTYLFPATISARTYLKQQDFNAATRLVYTAEPLATLAHALGDNYPDSYLDRGWKYLLSNHTHDANGGCAPDMVCQDMEYRYRKTTDISDIVSENAMSYIAANVSPGTLDKQAMQFVVFNPLPFKRDAIVKADMEVPSSLQAQSVIFQDKTHDFIERQPVYNEKSSVFMDNIWDVPTILESERIVLYAHFRDLPALGYRCLLIQPEKQELRTFTSMITGDDSMENEFIAVKVNPDATVNITNKETGRTFANLNYITDQGEAGNAWQHEDLRFDKKINSLGVASINSITESGPLVCTISCEFSLQLPVDYGDSTYRNEKNTEVPVKIDYTLEKQSRYVKVVLSIVNNAKDHWLRVNFPTNITSDYSVADSHYDVVKREIKLPDSSGWVEEAKGTHPLRTFVDISDGNEGLAIFTKGIFEYEAFDVPQRTIALTLIRACRIKLKVSEEKTTELPDPGIQCPGNHTFEYAICPHPGDYADAGLTNIAAEYCTPVRALMSGRGKGNLPGEAFLFSLDNLKIHVTAVKKAEKSSDIVIRMFNTTTSQQSINLRFPFKVKATKITMDERYEEMIEESSERVMYMLSCKEILSVKISR